MSYLKKYSSIIIGYFNYQNNHAAALAYYSLFALIPIAFVSFSLFGRIFGQETIEQILIRFLSNQVGLKDTAAIVEFFTNTQFTKPNIWMELLSVVAIIVTTSAMTSSVKRGVNDILDVPIKKRTHVDLVKEVIQFRLFSILAIALFMLFLIVVYFSQLFLISLLDLWFSEEYFLFQVALSFISFGLSYFSYFSIFFIVYKYGHDGVVEFKTVAEAALFSSTVVCISQFAIKYYLQHFFVFKDAGLTGSILVILTWIYFTSHILFMGAFYLKREKNKLV